MFTGSMHKIYIGRYKNTKIIECENYTHFDQTTWK